MVNKSTQPRNDNEITIVNIDFFLLQIYKESRTETLPYVSIVCIRLYISVNHHCLQVRGDVLDARLQYDISPAINGTLNINLSTV